MRIGFIGLGLMGLPMAKNILKAGFQLTVYNRTSAKTKELQKLGALVAKSPQVLGETCDVIITMITAAEDVRDVLFGPKGVVKHAKKGLIVIDMGTIGMSNAQAIAKKLHNVGIEFLDAPVTGSTPKAISGELIIFIGGNREVFEKVKKVLLAMGTVLHYVGETGSGQAIKLINNYLIAANLIALSESMLLADIMKLPRKRVAEILPTVPAASPMINLKLPNYVANNFPLLFSTANITKDLNLAVYELKKSRKNLPGLKQATRLYHQAVKKNLGAEDLSAIIKVLE